MKLPRPMCVQLLLYLRMTSELVTSWTYATPNKTMTWLHSRAWCRNNYTDLMVIQNEEQHEHLKQKLEDKKYWIGLRKTNGEWTWQGTGKPVEGKGSWFLGEPNNKKHDEDCVEMYILHGNIERNGNWNDEKCHSERDALCYTAHCEPNPCTNGTECQETIGSYTCIPQQCPPLSNPEKGWMTCSHPHSHFSYGSSCSFRCEEGYILTGEPTAKCSAAGSWSQENPSCDVLRCSALKSFPHGSIHCMDPVEEFSYGSSCWMECDFGFQLIGSNFTLCNSQGKWSHSLPVCEAQQCPLLSNPEKGWMNCSHPHSPFSYGSSCSFRCEEGYIFTGEPTVNCSATGSWSQENPSCDAPPCKPLSVLGGGNVNCSEGITVSCMVECPPGHLLLGTEKHTCQADGSWSHFQPLCASYDQLLMASAGFSVLLAVCYCILCCSLCRKRKKTIRAQEAQMNPAFDAGSALLEDPLSSV